MGIPFVLCILFLAKSLLRYFLSGRPPQNFKCKARIKFKLELEEAYVKA
jgi:hypothetical protein